MRNCLVVLAILASAHVAHADTVTLGKPKIVRGEKYIVDFDMTTVSGTPEMRGAGGVEDANGFKLEGCTDMMGSTGAGWKGRTLDGGNGLTLTVADVNDAGKSGRGWAGRQCGFAITDSKATDLGVDVPVAGVPAFNAPTAIVRDGKRVFMPINFNGYAKETGGKGNFVVALDLANHKELWRSANMTSNSQVLYFDGVVVTGYGFTAEKHELYVFDATTGKQLQKFTLPKSPGQIIKTADKLYVSLYDGYAIFPITKK
ncbi:MAG TPA: hypothetical protein VGM39_04030 [Kofleriaceae bacterium]